MRVVRLSLYQIDIPMTRAITTADGATTTLADVTIVKLTTADRAEGWGAVSPLWEGSEPGMADAVRDQIRASDIVGADIKDRGTVEELFTERGRMLTPGWSAIDCAMWDLLAKHAHLPTARCLDDGAGHVVNLSDVQPATSVAQCGGITGVLRLAEAERTHLGEQTGTGVELAAIAHLAAATGATMADHTIGNLLDIGGGVTIEGSIASVPTRPGTITEPNLGVLGHPIEELS